MTIRTRPKGPIATARAAKARKDRAYAKKIRGFVFERDVVCRAWVWNGNDEPQVGPCSGDDEWAHFGKKKRFKTRGMAPAARHSAAFSLVLCTKHHSEYDTGKLEIIALTDRFCDGPLEFVRGSAKA